MISISFTSWKTRNGGPFFFPHCAAQFHSVSFSLSPAALVINKEVWLVSGERCGGWVSPSKKAWGKGFKREPVTGRSKLSCLPTLIDAGLQEGKIKKNKTWRVASCSSAYWSHPAGPSLTVDRSMLASKLIPTSRTTVGSHRSERTPIRTSSKRRLLTGDPETPLQVTFPPRRPKSTVAKRLTGFYSWPFCTQSTFTHPRTVSRASSSRVVTAGPMNGSVLLKRIPTSSRTLNVLPLRTPLPSLRTRSLCSGTPHETERADRSTSCKWKPKSLSCHPFLKAKKKENQSHYLLLRCTKTGVREAISIGHSLGVILITTFSLYVPVALCCKTTRLSGPTSLPTFLNNKT